MDSSRLFVFTRAGDVLTRYIHYTMRTEYLYMLFLDLHYAHYSHLTQSQNGAQNVFTNTLKKPKLHVNEICVLRSTLFTALRISPSPQDQQHFLGLVMNLLTTESSL